MGNLDKEFITVLRDTCLKVIQMLKVATAEGTHDFLKKRKVVECTSQQIAETLNSIVLDNAIIEIKSTYWENIILFLLDMYVIELQAELLWGLIQKQSRQWLQFHVVLVLGLIKTVHQMELYPPQTYVYYTKWMNFEF
ncbi:hypothetical protein R3W88_014617 [Solanum pinnatisectum]|uniref:Uncharacterized protein n=1 Tax=Solanum pinnatisectum TaxID=50273 RepID=A0AAV9KSH9_9SOLN|nr:hypothetical protein R3W88_014617 [Solanum pinnatisectum]